MLAWVLTPWLFALTASTPGPSVHITASQTVGEGSLSVQLRCDCIPGTSPIVAYAWDLGEMGRVNTPTVRQTFGPGRFVISLVVVDALGVRSRDEMELVVKDNGLEPPRCAATVSSSSAVAPADVTWVGTQAQGSSAIKKAYWVSSTGRVAESATMTRTALPSGWHSGVWVVEDEKGLTCRYRVETVLYDSEASALALKAPPEIVSVPSNLLLSCADTYRYGEEAVLRASGEGTRTWTLVRGPTGMVLDSKTGAVTWVATPDDRGENELVFRVATEHGTDTQETSAQVSCASEMELTTPFGCSASGTLNPLGSLLLLLLPRRRVRISKLTRLFRKALVGHYR